MMNIPVKEQRMTILAHEKEIVDCARTLLQVKEQNDRSSLWSKRDIAKLEKKLNSLKQKVYSNLNPWERVTICRHPARPQTSDYLNNITDEYEEIFGDRTFKDDHSMMTCLAKINGQKFVIIGQEKGKDTESRLYRNFGMANPEGYRKALRAMKLAEKFRLPVVTLIDTPGAYPGLAAEERGQGWLIAKNLWEMARLSTPIISVLIGEGCSGGAIGIGVGDVLGMLEHSYYSVISPEGCASILWKDPSKNGEAATALKMQAEDLLKLQIIDEIIKEPLGGAHLDPSVVFENVKNFLLAKREVLMNIAPEALIERRYLKFRKIGAVSSN